MMLFLSFGPYFSDILEFKWNTARSTTFPNYQVDTRGGDIVVGNLHVAMEGVYINILILLPSNRTIV